MGNPFAINSVNMFKPVNSVGAVGSRGAQGAGKAGTPSFGGATPYQNDMNDFQKCISNWNGAPQLNMPGDPKLNFYS